MSIKLNRAVSAAAAVAVLTVTPLAAAGSAAAGAAAPTPSVSKDGLVEKITPRTNAEGSDLSTAAYNCGTSFVPINPHGGSLYQTFHNCTNVDVWVTTGFWFAGKLTQYNEVCQKAWANSNSHNEDVVGWKYASTIPSGAQYVTVSCKSGGGGLV